MIGQDPVGRMDPEVTAALDFLESLDVVEAQYISFSEIRKRKKILKDAGLVWFHRSDTTEFSEAETDKKTIRYLLEYVSGGGSLLLTLDGFRYLNLLGVESTRPSVRSKASADEGYGRKLGFHAYREHPLFTGLNGGAYIYKPVRDLTVRVHGFFGDTVPEQGNVVAIDWDYIFFREHSKLITEYDLGNGKILAIGGYLLFNAPNDHRMHLEVFAENIMDYLTGKMGQVPIYYWDYSPPAVVPCRFEEQKEDIHVVPIPAPVSWEFPADPLTFPVHPATNNYCEAAGQRILIMGQEKGGIEEVWTHPFMAIRDLRSGIRDGRSGFTTPLSDLIPDVEIRTDCFIRHYHVNGGLLREVVSADPERPCGVIHYEWLGTETLDLSISFTSNLRLMWPYPATCTGSLCYGRDEASGAFFIRAPADELVVFVGGNQIPARSFMAPGEGYSIDAGASYLLAPGQALDVVVAAGSEGFQEVHSLFEEAVCDPRSIVSRAGQQIENLFAERLMVTSPDPGFNEGYRWALLGTDRFFVTTPGMGSALVAGYGTTRRGWDGAQKVSGRPGYAWYFGRDGQWSGFALLDYGDFEKVRNNLEFFLKYQDLNGKIFHEATTSGVVHYDASDATPLFLVLAGRYFRHSWDTMFVRKNWSGIKKAINFCLSSDTDGDHLIENTNVGHGWVEGGQLYGSHTSFYLAGCWAAALEESILMAEVAGDPVSGSYREELRRVKEQIDRRFWNTRELFYAYGLNKNGTQRTDPTILPAVPAYFGVTERFRMRYLLDQWASNAFSTNWGIRIIREDSPLFRPTGYHYGSVWPLFTGWAALAEYRFGNYLQGFTHIMNNLDVYRNWGLGYVEEVLNGAEYQPSGVCPHQCWSETMVLQPIIEGMLGLEAFAHQHTLRLAPRLPAHWDSLQVDHIRIGDHLLTMHFRRDSTVLHWEFLPEKPTPLVLDFMPSLPPGTRVGRVWVNGEDHPFTTFNRSRFITLQLNVMLHDTTCIEVEYRDGISALPLIPSPAPGERAEGMRIIDARLTGNRYSIDLEGLTGTSDTLSIWSYLPVEEVMNGHIICRKDHVTKILVDFPVMEMKYARTTVSLPLIRRTGFDR